MKKLNIFHYINLQIWFAALVAATIYFLSRLVLLWVFKGDLNAAAAWHDIYKALKLGFFYDLKVLAVFFAPVFLFSLIGLALPEPYLYRIQKVVRPFSVFVTIFFAVASALGFYYFHLFQQPVDIFVFGAVDEDLRPMLVTAWHTLPIFKILLAVVLGFFLCYKIYYNRFSIPAFTISSRKFSLALCVVWIVAYAYAARGSFGKFPLRRGMSIVSTHHLINSMVPNSMIGLMWAFQDRRGQMQFEHVKADAGRKIFGLVSNDTTLDSDWIRKNLIQHTPENRFLADHPPHVVFTFMESQSGFLLKFHDTKTNNLLGSLEKHIKSDFFFERFLSFGDGTNPTFMRLLMLTPFDNLQGSVAQNTSFYSSMARVYKQAGYRTVFVSSANLGWRRMGFFLKNQSFDELYDYNTIAEHLSNSEMGPWGVADHHSFDFAVDLLKKNDEKSQPTFIFIKTSTNHPPYNAPKSYSPLPVTVAPELPGLLRASSPNAKNILLTYQYANNALGDFITKIKNSKLGSHTILSASGDHTLREIRLRDDSQTFFRHQVPFYLYVPKDYLKNVPYKYDPRRMGSHRDMWPTMYHFSLSGADYLNLGRNLLATEDHSPYTEAYNNNLVADTTGGFVLRGKKVFFEWESFQDLLFKAPRPVDEQTQGATLKRYESYEEFLIWLTLWQYQNKGKILPD